MKTIPEFREAPFIGRVAEGVGREAQLKEA
jgi:hypothetical protein